MVNRTSFVGSQYANRLLSALLITLSVLLADHTADYTGYYYFAPLLMEIGDPLPFLIGPLLWGYVKVQTSSRDVNFRKSHLLHLIPALLALLVVLPFVLGGGTDAKILYYYEHWFDLDYYERMFDLAPTEISVAPSCEWYRPWLWPACTVTLELISGQPDFNLHLKSPLALIWLSDFTAIALWVSLIIYIGCSVVLLKRHLSSLRQLTSNTQNRDLRWLSFFIALLMLAAVVYIVISFQEKYLASTWLDFDTRVYVTYILLAISVMYLGVLAIRQPVIYTDDLLLNDRALTPNADVGSSAQSAEQTAEVNALLANSDTDTSASADLQKSKYRTRR